VDEIASEIESDDEQTGMGQGDAKLAGAIGAFLLLGLSLVSFFLAVASGAIIGIGLMIARGRSGKTAIPFGPYLVVGAIVALLVGGAIESWYIRYAFPAG
jgi:leader peptidase (prepilin peptidase)/N-methyltransferase